MQHREVLWSADSTADQTSRHTSAHDTWRAAHPEDRTCPSRVAEVAFYRGYEQEGVLPLIDASVPENVATDHFAWLAMPEATVAGKALSGAPLVRVVAAVASFAETLAELGSEGVSHRDIKPENLFLHDRRWKVGDCDRRQRGAGAR